MVSRQDFEAIAKMIRNARVADITRTFMFEGIFALGDSGPIEDIVHDLCKYFIDQNPRFDEERFKDACRPK